MNNKLKKNYNKKSLLLSLLVLLLPALVFAQAEAPAKSEIAQPAAWILISIMVVLIFAIIVLSGLVKSSYEIYKKRMKKAESIIPILIIGLLIFGLPAHAQDTTAVAAEPVSSTIVSGISNTSFYFMMATIILELIIVIFLVRTFRLFAGLKKEPVEKAITEKVKKKKISWFEKFNNTKSVNAEAESQVNLGHDYDGIGELDNPTPPWWQWGFVISVIFAVVYLYTNHISHSTPTQFQELAIANAKAEEKQQEYLASSANKIDENNAVYLSDAADLAEGKAVFTSVCAACHGADGGGIVGPNLTDEYWLHGGSIKSIFKTIKYGVPEKGMKSWKDDYPPKKIEQIASYIHSLKGTKPAAPKEPQGDKFVETDSTTIK